MIGNDDINMVWSGNKDLSIVISCIKNPLWNEKGEDFENKYLIRTLFQKCSGGKVVEMLKKTLSGEEKSALVKSELESFFQTQMQMNQRKTKSCVFWLRHQTPQFSGKCRQYRPSRSA